MSSGIAPIFDNKKMDCMVTNVTVHTWRQESDLTTKNCDVLMVKCERPLSWGPSTNNSITIIHFVKPVLNKTVLLLSLGLINAQIMLSGKQPGFCLWCNIKQLRIQLQNTNIKQTLCYCSYFRFLWTRQFGWNLSIRSVFSHTMWQRDYAQSWSHHVQ